MSWIDLAWPLMAGICFTLALIHFDIGVRGRANLVHLLFSVICLSVGTIAIMEIVAMRTMVPADFARILRWGHAAMCVLTVGLVWFVRLSFRAGNVPLGIAISAFYVIGLVANFTTGDNLHFRETTGLARIQMWGGEIISTPMGVANPWMATVQASLLLMVVFLGQVIVTVWRRGDVRERVRVVAVCGSIQFFMLVAAVEAIAAVWFGKHVPISINPGFVPVLFVMSMDLGGDILRAAQLAQRLKASDDSLRLSQLRTSLAVRAADIGLWGWDADHGERWMSDVTLRMLGLRHPDAFRLRDLLRRVHPEDRTAMLAALADALRHQGEFKAEFRIDADRQAMRWLGIRGHVETSPSGGRPRFSGVLVDITERKAADLRFQQVVEAAPVAMLMANREGHVVLANLKAQAVFGQDRSRLVHAELARLLPPPDDAATGIDPLADWLRTGDLATAPDQPRMARHADGRELPVDVAASPVWIAGESFVLVSVTDISERKRMEREAALQRDELAHLSRVALLAELSGSLAHELNQPLTAILSNAQAGLRFMAHAPPDLEEVTRSLVNIVENDKRAGEVIRRLRAMLRKDPADHRPLEVNEVVQDVLRIIRSDLLNRSIELVLDLAPGLPLVDGDRVQLQQVLLNLVMNGSDAMEGMRKGRRLTVRTRLIAPSHVEVAVSDVGTGIPEEDLERIFSPFVTSKAEGMGLGLAVCTTIVQSHGGKLWASNNPDGGATLSLSLPAHR
ncbi:MAG: PAS domain S-box protein [Xanthomonadales bacterium]|nr:PAS domain S-box protein [Xanthomonadales bacterium]